MNPLDLQVNGFGGVDFNSDQLSSEALHLACERLRNAGGGEFLATIITTDMESMCRRLAAIARFRESDSLIAETLAGIHIEGPFINESPGYAGAHPVDAVLAASPDLMRRLLDAAGGLTKVVTLAPERDNKQAVIKLLSNDGICVSAGHCNPTIQQLRAAVDSGLKMFTHLGNGCPMQLHRHDNIIQRVLSLADELWICFIADGVHVNFPALRNYLRCAGVERSIIVTDAISAAGLGPGTYTLGDQKIKIGPDLVARAPGGSHFVGSTVSMKQTTANLQEELGLSMKEIRLLLDINPRAATGM